ncbi:MFS transporter [Rhodococcus sp. D2-41]|uniref:MFS transporter n=1 Tax=Speluncibacter jeojiensis TaxID=2710754 RepID=A0A9X4LZ02_9ACTN|nr:MFS transporter [Rhodococcus sp. D2-41]MDG3011678.1 MFS transporter [Rhodococcus sp. D2-41]MDG3014968.1 MFS transporter [Corynebacteriales bacterium D3-21]
MSVSLSPNDGAPGGVAATTGGAPGARPTRYWIGILAILLLLTEQAAMAFALFTPALPKIAEKYQTTQVVWVMTALTLAAAVSSPLLGKLADIHGKKRMIVVTAVISSAGGLISALAPTFPILIAGRFLSGVGFAFTALGYTLIRDIFPERLQPISISLANTGVGVITVIAPLATGVLIDHVGVSAVFWFSFGLSALGGLLALAFVPETPVRARTKVDWPGAVLLTLGLFLLMLGLSQGSHWHWISVRTVGCFVIAVAAIVGWVLWERAVAEPLIEVRMLASRKLGLTLLAGGIAYGATTLISSLLPMLMQTPSEAASYGFGLSVTDMAWWMLPGGVGIVAAGFFVGATARSIGFRRHLMLGAFLIGFGAIILATVPGSAWLVIAAWAVVGFGCMVYAAVPNLVLQALPPHQRAVGSNFTGMAQALSGSLLSTIGFAVLAQNVLQVGSHGVVYSAHGFTVAFAIAAAAGLVGAVIATALPRSRD